MPTEDSEKRDTPSSEETYATPLHSGVSTDQNPHTSARGSSPSKRSASQMDNDDIEMRESIETDHGMGSNAYLAAQAGGNQYLEMGRQQRFGSAETAGHEQVDGTTASTSVQSASGSVSAQPASTTTSVESSPFHMTAPTDDRIVESQDQAYSGASYDKQYSDIVAASQREITDGEVGYLVSTRWLQRIIARTSHPPADVDKTAAEGEVGRVDNSSIKAPPLPNNPLLDEGKPQKRFVPLTPGLRIGDDFEIVPSDLWQRLKDWYGLVDDATEIRRFAHETSEPDSTGSNIQYEVYPPIFTLRRIRSTVPNTHQSTTDLAPLVVVSRSQQAQKFLSTAKSKLIIPMDHKVRVWRVLKQEATIAGASDIMTPPNSDDESPAVSVTARPKKFIDSAEFEAMETGTHKAELEDFHDRSNDANYNGSATVGLLGLGEDQTLILEEVSTSNSAGGKSVGTATKALQAGKPQGASGRTSPAPSGITTRGRTQRYGRGRGTVGLQNLGNTCYMNSALQCIRSVEELTQFFLSDQWKKELNPGNPLGHGGNVAKVYAGLISTMYESSTSTSFGPRNFKQTLGRYAPMFSGYGQQDSQEFMSFLVDGLHEDLNRIHKKPYIENPESDDNTVDNPDAIRALGETFRENHRARNDSIAMDLFNGFYKNTMVCPICSKVSITFDPFSLLTLQLPFEQTWQHRIWFFPMYGPPISVDVDMDKNGSIRMLKEYIMARIPGLQREKLLVTEIFNNKFFKIFEDNAVISESNIQTNDKIAVYELEEAPTNWPPKKKPPKATKPMYTYSYGPDDSEEEPTSEMADRMLVPIFHQTPTNSVYTKNLSFWPLLISLTPEEAADYDTILRKVLSRVGTMTTKKILEEEHIGFDPSYNSKNGSDAVITTDEDASSNADPTVKAHSIDDDGSIVDVSMGNGTDRAETDGEATDVELPGAKYHPPPPTILQPGTFIPGQLQNLFSMRRYHAGKVIIPTGMTISFDKTTPIEPPQHAVASERRSSLDTSSSATESPESVSDEDVDDPPEKAHSFDVNGQDDDDSESLPEVADLVKGNKSRAEHVTKPSRNRRPQGLVTYSKKGKHATQPYGFDGATDTAEEGDELVQLGDVIILDWTSAAVDTLFSGAPDDQFRGQETLSKNMEVLDDPALKAKQAKRTARKKAGVSLEECFAETSKSEILSEENAWYCGRCKEMRRASKTLEVWTLPEILVVHLKRFGSNGRMRDKLEVLVDFPVEGLDLNKRVGLPEGKEHTYDLFAVDNHYGGLGGGHYTAYAKNFVDGKWYDYNDSSVSAVGNPERVVTSSAYLLFYRRRSSKPLGPEYLQKLVGLSHEDEAEQNINGDAEIEATDSRNASPSGQGKGQSGGPYSNGSPSTLAGAGAARQAANAQAGLRGGRESPARIEDTAMDDDMDEGYSEGPYAGGTSFIGPQQPVTQRISDIYAPLWNFKNADRPEGAEAEDDEAGSNDATGSDTLAEVDAEDVRMRLLEEADDEDFSIPKINVSPDPYVDDLTEDPPPTDIVLDDNVEAALDKDAKDFGFGMD